MKINSSERGQALVIIAIAIIGLVGILGLVVDGGNAFLDRRNAQGAADSAALAAALIRIRGEQDWVAAAMTAAANNGYNNDGVTNTVTLYSPPKDGPFVGNIEYIQIEIVSHVDTYFAKIIGTSKITNIVEATARSKPSEVKEILHGLAVISLAPSSNCGNKKAFWVHGNAELNVSGGIFINSGNRDCAFMQEGNGSIHVQNGTITVVGGVSIQRPQLLTPGVNIGGSAMNYPPPFFMPNATCGDEIAQINADETSMTPGTWDEKFPPDKVINLEPGVYCLEKGIDLTGNQTLAGQNVVFIIMGGEVQLGGNANVTLSAPIEGDYKGLLIYAPIEVETEIKLSGGPSSTFEGTILAPASDIIMQGNSASSVFHSQIIGYRINIEGSSKISVIYDNDQNYDALTMPEIQLSE